MRKSTLQILVVSIILILMLPQCVYNEIPEPEIPDSVSFNTDIIPIFNASCNMSGCHNQGGFDPDLSAQNAWASLQDGYVNLSAPESSTLVTAMDGGTMEPYSKDQDIALIIKWISDGAKNN